MFKRVNFGYTGKYKEVSKLNILSDDLGAYIREKRKELGYTIEEVSDRINRSKGYLSRIENNTSTPSFEMLAKLADALRFPLEEVCEITATLSEAEEIDLIEVIREYPVKLNGRLLESGEKYKLIQLIETVEKTIVINESNYVTHLSKIMLLVDQYKKEVQNNE